MKNLIKTTSMFLLTAGIASQANAIPATATANVRAPILITAGNDLRFGDFAKPETGSGTITEAGTVAGGVANLGGTRGAATFNVTGDGNRAYTLTIPSTVELKLTPTSTAASEKMTSTLSPVGGTSRNLSAGAEVITVNGTLTVASTNVTGAYSGTYAITVAYQ